MDDGVYAYVRNAGDVFSGGCIFVEDPDPNVTGNVLRVRQVTNNNYSEHLRYVLSSGQNVAGMAARVYFPSLPGANVYTPQIFNFNDGGNNRQVALTLDSTGACRVRFDMNDTEEQYATPGPVFVAGTWHHIEMKVDFTAGDIEVRVEGVPVIELTGKDIGTGPCAQVAFGNQNGVGQIQSPQWIFYKDFVIWDGQGSENNDFFGNVQVYMLDLVSDIVMPWTPSTGTTGWNLLDESPANDADYISADDTPPAACQFGLSDLPEDVTSIRGIKTFIRARKTDGGDGNLQVSMNSDGTDGNGNDRPITTIYTYWTDVFPLDPATDLPWTRFAVNEASIKVSRTL
tara:strand:- start:12356 stop:13384 length:1029 start_codon:yes stop_codon:yes gene_type:complete